MTVPWTTKWLKKTRQIQKIPMNTMVNGRWHQYFGPYLVLATRTGCDHWNDRKAWEEDTFLKTTFHFFLLSYSLLPHIFHRIKKTVKDHEYQGQILNSESTCNSQIPCLPKKSDILLTPKGEHFEASIYEMVPWLTCTSNLLWQLTRCKMGKI